MKTRKPAASRSDIRKPNPNVVTTNDLAPLNPDQSLSGKISAQARRLRCQSINAELHAGRSSDTVNTGARSKSAGT